MPSLSFRFPGRMSHVLVRRHIPALVRRLLGAAGRSVMDLLDLVYPPTCLVCRVETTGHGGGDLCPPCRDGLPLLEGTPCPGCGSAPVMSPVDFCPRCQGTCRRDGLVTALQYTGTARDLVRAFKYNGDLAAGDLLSRLLVTAPGIDALPVPAAVVPVPLHRGRLAERGFNQAALLGRALARRLNAPFRPRALRRLEATTPLSGLGPSGRRREVAGSFAVSSPAAVSGGTVLLVDDVVTTGATTEECCRILKAAGAGNVYVAAAARRLRQRALH